MPAGRYRILLSLFLCISSLSAFGQEEQKNIIIVDGKKFFPLYNARHFSGTGRPMPVSTEKRMQKSPVIIVPRKKLPPIKTPEKPAKPEIPLQENPTLPPKTPSEEILSIFEPEGNYPEKSGIRK